MKMKPLSLACLLLLMLFPLRGWAVLGEDADLGSTSPGIHALKMVPTKRVGNTIRVMDHSEGTVTIREYVGPDNKVFAVKWKGHGFPNLQVLLGRYHAEYSIATTMPTRRIRRRGLASTSDNLEIMQYGTMGNIHGHIILKDRIPPGVRADELP